MNELKEKLLSRIEIVAGRECLGETTEHDFVMAAQVKRRRVVA